jgi:RHS repeat-associated protein
VPTQQQRFQQLTDGDNFSIDGKARLPERRRRWIRLVDAPLPGAAKTTLPRYEYGMYGEVTQTVGTLSADFGYAGYYVHGPSGLNLTTYRAYSPSLGRWINRDPIEEDGGINLYDYADNDPVDSTDPLGLIGIFPRTGPYPPTPTTTPSPTGGTGTATTPRRSPPGTRPKRPPRRRPCGYPPPPPPPKGPRDDKPRECSPPPLGTDPEIKTFMQCILWCDGNCDEDLKMGCFLKCYKYPL